jgi:hypothetical protein
MQRICSEKKKTHPKKKETHNSPPIFLALHPEPRGLAQATGASVPESALLGSLGTGGVVTMCSGDTDDFTWLVV